MASAPDQEQKAGPQASDGICRRPDHDARLGGGVVTSDRSCRDGDRQECKETGTGGLRGIKPAKLPQSWRLDPTSNL